MRRDEINELHYITAIANVPSILEHGILCHSAAGKLAHQDISMASVQDIRSTKRVPGGLLLHEYAPLYIWARNVMLYKRSSEMLDELCVLAVGDEVLELDDVVIADHNAAAGIANFEPSPDGLDAIDKSVTFAKYWGVDDPIETGRRKKAMCAEVLVPHGIHPSHITEAYVGSDAALATFESLGTPLSVRIREYLFFK